MHTNRDSPADSIRAPGEGCFGKLNCLKWTEVDASIRFSEIIFSCSNFCTRINICVYEINETLSWTTVPCKNQYADKFGM
jgi:hypothetical protein